MCPEQLDDRNAVFTAEFFGPLRETINSLDEFVHSFDRTPSQYLRVNAKY